MVAFEPNDDKSEFEEDLIKNGYHIYNKKKARNEGFYPKKFSHTGKVLLKYLRVKDIVVVRSFFISRIEPNLKYESGKMDLRIEIIKNNVIYGKIMTELPTHYCLSKGSIIELSINEIIGVLSKDSASVYKKQDR